MALRLLDTRALRPLLAAMLFVVLGVRVIVPTGFMPMISGHGVVVTLCTGQGAMTVVVDKDIPGQPAKPKPVAADDCPFAGGASAAALPFVAILPAAAWFGAQTAIAFALKTGWIARLAAPPPPAMGPPTTL